MIMMKLSLAVVAMLAFAGLAHAAELPASVLNQDWCARPMPSEIYVAVPGCKSLVFRQDALFFNEPGRQMACRISSLKREGSNGMFVIKGICQDGAGATESLYFRFGEIEHGCLPLEGYDHCLLTTTKPGIPGGVAPKLD